MVSGMTMYQLLWFFLLYSFLGWVGEVVYQALTLGVAANRGFLNGPVCPIYGVGAVGVLCLLSPYASGGAEESLPVLFLSGTALATVIELTGGWVLDRLFHTRWWDYSDKPFHFHGYICPQFSLLWGFVILMSVELLHPWLRDRLVAGIPVQAGEILLGVCYVGLAADLTLTVAVLSRMNRYLAELDRIQASMRSVSNSLSTLIGTTSLKTAQRVEEGQVQAALGRAEVRDAVNAAQRDMEQKRRALERKRQSLQRQADGLYERMMQSFVMGRLLDAFPGLHSLDHAEPMERLKRRWQIWRRERAE